MIWREDLSLIILNSDPLLDSHSIYIVAHNSSVTVTSTTTKKTQIFEFDNTILEQTSNHNKQVINNQFFNSDLY